MKRGRFMREGKLEDGKDGSSNVTREYGEVMGIVWKKCGLERCTRMSAARGGGGGGGVLCVSSCSDRGARRTE